MKRILTLIMAMMTMVCLLAVVPVSADSSETDYYAMSPTANSYNKDGGAIALTWRNPIAALSNVSLYQISSDGTETPVDENMSTDSGACQVKIIEGLDAAQVYQYKVVSQFTDGHPATTVILSSDAAGFTTDSFKAPHTGIGQYSGTQFGKRVGDTDKTPEFYIDPEVKYDGTASLHIKNNYETADAVFTFNTGKLTAGENNYTLSGYVKANKYKPNTLLGWFNNSSNGAVFQSITEASNETTCDWQTFSIPISGTQGDWDDIFVKTVFAQYPAEDLWVDDLKLTENSTGTDVFLGLGSFENYTAPAAPSATAVEIDNKVRVNIDAPDDSRKLYVYETIGDQDIVRAVLDTSVTSLILEGVTGTLKVSAKSNASASQNVMSVKNEVKVPDETDYYGYAPTFTAAAEDGTKVELSWRNPAAGCRKVSLYDVTNPLHEVLIADTYPTAAGTPVSEVVEGLTADEQYLYKVVFEFDGHDATSLLMGGYAETVSLNSTGKSISGSSWNVYTYGMTQNAVAVGIDTDVNAPDSNGKASLHLSMNGSAYGNTWLRHSFPSDQIVAGKTYVLSLKVKADQYIPRNSMIGQLFRQGWWQFINGREEAAGAFDFEWMTLTKEITATDTDNGWPYLDIMLPRMSAKDMWIDDITFCEKGSTENLVANGDFENYSPAFEVIDATVQSVGDGSATIGYTIPSATQAVYIYQKIGDKLIQRANVSEIDSVTIDSLQNGTENELVIKTLSSDYVLSEGVTVTASPELPQYRTGSYKLYNGEMEISKPETGELTVKLDVTNFEMGDDFSPCYIVALYDDNMCLMDYEVIDDVVIAENETVTLTASVTVDAGAADCKIKAFLWKDFETMGILKSNGEF